MWFLLQKLILIFKEPPVDPTPLPLLDSPLGVLMICAGYLVFVLKLGKIYMHNRKPYNVRRLLLFYNVAQILCNAYIFIFTFDWVIVHSVYRMACMEALPPTHAHKAIERRACYYFFLMKIFDLLDTVFFVLRRNFKQISFLHVYHHVMMPLVSYAVYRYYGYGGHVTLMGIINMFVHMVMYFYYFMAALQSNVKRGLWWKKYVTMVQIAQFVIVSSHTAYVIVKRKSNNCDLPPWMLWLNLSQSTFMLVMFARFYVGAYLKPKTS